MFKRILTYSILSLIALGGFFGNVDIDIQSINNISEITVQFTGNNAYAASGETASSDSVKMYNNLISSLNIALAVLSAMISPIILFVGWLMSPDWTSGDLFGLRAPMYALWVTVSNIVYFIYAILLILIALGTMFGQDKFSYKVMLPKLALGIIMVPFTWWFVQWTISIASVVTATVMTIPAETIASGDSAWFNKPSIPKGVLIDSRGSGSITETKCEENPDTCISPKSFLKTSGGMFGPLIVYGYSIFKFKEIQELKSGLDIASAALQIVHTSIISTIMFAVFGLLTLALASMLLVRAMKLWMYAIFAPLFTFRFVAGSNLLGGDDDSFSIKEFIGLAFVPAIVGLTLSFGLIIINAVQGPANPTVTAGTTCNLESAEGCTILNIMGSAENKITRKVMTDGNSNKFTSTTFAFGGIEFLFLGKATNQVNTSSTASGAIDAVGGMFGTLIVDVIALVFIWMAFMAAKNVSKAVKAAVEPFEKIGTQVGSLAKSLPKYTPLPIPGGSISGMGKASADLAHLPEVAANKRYDESAVGKFMKSHNDGPSAQEMENLRGTILSHPENMRSTLQGASFEKLKQMYTKIEENKGKFDNDPYLDSIGVKDSKQKEIIKKIIKDGPKNDEDYARLYAILAYDAKHDVSAETAKAMIKAGKATGGSGASGTAGTSGFTATKAANDNIIFNFNGGPSIVLDKKVSVDMKASDIAKSINDHKDDFKEENKIDKVSLEKMLTGLGRVDAKKVAEDVFKDLNDKVKKS